MQSDLNQTIAPSYTKGTPGNSQHSSRRITQSIIRQLSQPANTAQSLPSPPKVGHLLNHYLSFRQLNARLYDLPIQFKRPQMRPWQVIEWQAIAPDQIVGISPAVYLAVLAGCMNIEAPIHDYSHTSWHYLQQLYPDMAEFVGGVRTADGSLLKMGLWEKEERQHAPILHRLYKQLAGQPPQQIKLCAKEYKPTGDPHQDLFRHGLHRTTTEYGATCLYLWLMAHSIGALQDLIAELLRDEVNHMTKFLGFGLWAFPGSQVSLSSIYARAIAILLGKKMRFLMRFPWISQLKHSFTQLLASHSERHSCSALLHTGQSPAAASRSTKYQPPTTKLLGTFSHVMGLVNWQIWAWPSKVELIWVFMVVLWRLHCWSRRLTNQQLRDLFGIPPLANLDQIQIGGKS
jgi:hypothetical protein